MSNHNFKPVRKVVFPVAGLGTRFLPATKVVPKEMLPLADRPLIQHAVEEARDAGIEEFIFVSSSGKNILETHFADHKLLKKTLENRGKTALLEKVKQSEIADGKLLTVYQNNPLGLGHAIWCAKKLVGDEPFAVVLADDVVLHEKGCLTQMIEAYNEYGGNIVSVMDVPKEDTSKYGILDVGADKGNAVEINGLVEKPDPADAPSTLSIIGRYILQPEVFGHLDAFETGAGGEIQITDAMAKLIGKQPFHGFRFEGTRYDCGSKLGFIEATLAYGLNDAELGPILQKAVKDYANSSEDKKVFKAA